MSREDFPMISREEIYLDSAATTLKPQVVLDELMRFYSQDWATVQRAIYTRAVLATEQYEAARKKVARFLHASPSEIVFTKSTTEALNLVADCLGRSVLQEGDEIIVSEMEHHSNLLPWQRLGSLKIWKVEENGDLSLDELKKLLTPRTKIVAVTHMSNVTGAINPIGEIARLAHSVGAVVVVDGAQSAPHLRIDVQRDEVDFFAFSGHKCYGPGGVGVLYGRKELLEQLPPYQVGGGIVQQVTLEGARFAAPPQRFEAGTPPIAEAIALGFALDYLSGCEDVEQSEHELLLLARKELQAIPGVRLLGAPQHQGPVLSFVCEGCHPLDVGTLLDAKGIAVRTGTLCATPYLNHFGLREAIRISFGLYTDEEEILRFSRALTEITKDLGKPRPLALSQV